MKIPPVDAEFYPCGQKDRHGEAKSSF